MDSKLLCVSDRDVFRSAQVLVDHHGPQAPVQAATQADRLIDEGAYEEFQTWFRIMRATIDLLRTELYEDEIVN